MECRGGLVASGGIFSVFRHQRTLARLSGAVPRAPTWSSISCRAIRSYRSDIHVKDCGLNRSRVRLADDGEESGFYLSLLVIPLRRADRRSAAFDLSRRSRAASPTVRSRCCKLRRTSGHRDWQRRTFRIAGTHRRTRAAAERIARHVREYGRRCGDVRRGAAPGCMEPKVPGDLSTCPTTSSRGASPSQITSAIWPNVANTHGCQRGEQVRRALADNWPSLTL